MDNIPNNPSLKPPKSFEEQIDLMVSRGLIVADREKAISILKRINYYRLSAYTLTLKNRNNQFKKGVTFQEIYLLYEFDQKLRTLLMPLMETVEIAFRTHIAYFLAIKYGNVAHLDKSIFRNEEQFRKFLEDLSKEISISKELFVKHHQQKYSGNFPIWVAIELISFGTLSKIFNNLNNEDANFICKEHYRIRPYYIRNWLHALSVTRNICAHYGRIYGRHLPVSVRLFQEEKSFPGNSFFAINLILKRLVLDSALWESYLTSLSALFEQYECVDIKHLGFPDNWESILRRSTPVY